MLSGATEEIADHENADIDTVWTWLWLKGWRWPRESEAHTKLRIKGTFRDISPHWKHKGTTLEADPDLENSRTVCQGTEKTLALYCKLHNVSRRRRGLFKRLLISFFTKKYNTLIFNALNDRLLNISVPIFSFPYTFITNRKRVFNVLMKNFKSHRTIIIFPIDHQDCFAWFQPAYSFHSPAVQSKDCWYIQHGWISQIQRWRKEASGRKVHTLWFHL